jgi:hypothetical protein
MASQALYWERIRLRRCVYCGKKRDKPGRMCMHCTVIENARHQHHRRQRRLVARRGATV